MSTRRKSDSRQANSRHAPRALADVENVRVGRQPGAIAAAVIDHLRFLQARLPRHATHGR